MVNPDQANGDSPKYFTLNGLMHELRMGRDAIRKALVNVTPAKTVQGGHPAWTLDQVNAALEASSSKGVTGPLKDQKIQEQIRQLQLANDKAAGRLVERAFVVEGFARVASKFAELRTQSEAAEPILLHGKDLTELRELVRQRWDTIGKALAECAKYFEEKKPNGPKQ